MRTLAIHQTLALSEQETHQAPPTAFSIDQAHTVMQYHVACRAKHCPRKNAALQALVAAGAVVVSEHHPR